MCSKCSSRTIPNETKQAYGQPLVDHDALDTSGGRRSLKKRVDNVVNQSSENTGNASEGPRVAELREEGFTVGRKADHHDLVPRGQP